MSSATNSTREPRNKGKLIGQKAPLKLKDIWAIRVRLQLMKRLRELALFDLGIDSKLRGCELVKLRVRDVCHGSVVASRTMVMQQKTQRPVQFEITAHTREAMAAWMKQANLHSEDLLFSSRFRGSTHLSTRQYAHIIHDWVIEIVLDPAAYGTHRWSGCRITRREFNAPDPDRV
jgi:site-specific recombinase XerC